jgi:hypothetical protein
VSGRRERWSASLRGVSAAAADGELSPSDDAESEHEHEDGATARVVVDGVVVDGIADVAVARRAGHPSRRAFLARATFVGGTLGTFANSAALAAAWPLRQPFFAALAMPMPVNF